MTEERYQYLNSLSIGEYDKQTSSKEQDEFCAYQKKYHPDEVIYCQTHSNDESENKDNMEEKELNLCELLKGHEGETFYSEAHGDVKFEKIQELRGGIKYIICSYVSRINNCVYTNLFLPSGKIVETGEVMLVPSKDQRDWIKWDKENNKKTPKTWSEYISQFEIESEPTLWFDTDMNWGSIGESCSALFKIHQLIEVGYGGNVESGICIVAKDGTFLIYNTLYTFSPFAFHTQEQAEEFLSYPENIQLLKDYFII